jgi:Uma2 family endonuclease
MAITTKGISLEEFLALPEEEPALEYADGEVTQKMSPMGKHSRLQSVLIERLNRAGEPQKLALALPELRTTYAGLSRVPDVAVYLWARLPVDDSGQIANRFTEPPDIAIEIVSTDQQVGALVRRCLWYVANGVELALLVDPLDETVFAFRQGEQTAAWRGEDRIDVGNILPDFQLTVQELFAELKIGE